MKLLVVNCNSWIGYHIVESLLNEGFRVGGVVDPNIDGDLEMFFGRNSLFKETSIDTNEEFDIGIVVDNHIKDLPSNVERWIHISDSGHTNHLMSNLQETTFIYPSLLVGEWMRMNQQGVYRDEEFIAFDSSEFTNQAIYIHDFSRALVQWIQIETLPYYFHVFPFKENYTNKKVEKMVYLRENRDIDTIIEKVKKHYEQFKGLN